MKKWCLWMHNQTLYFVQSEIGDRLSAILIDLNPIWIFSFKALVTYYNTYVIRHKAFFWWLTVSIWGNKLYQLEWGSGSLFLIFQLKYSRKLKTTTQIFPSHNKSSKKNNSSFRCKFSDSGKLAFIEWWLEPIF